MVKAATGVRGKGSAFLVGKTDLGLFRIIDGTSGECAAAYRAESSDDTKCIVYRSRARWWCPSALQDKREGKRRKRKVSPGRESDRVLRRDGWSEVKETERRLPSL